VAAFFAVLAAVALVGAGLSVLLLLGRGRVPLLARQEGGTAESSETGEQL